MFKRRLGWYLMLIHPRIEHHSATFLVTVRRFVWSDVQHISIDSLDLLFDLKHRETTLLSSGENPNMEVQNHIDTNIPTLAHHLSPRVTPEWNRVHLYSTRLVPEPKLCDDVSQCLSISTTSSFATRQLMFHISKAAFSNWVIDC